MNIALLRNHLELYKKKLAESEDQSVREWAERVERTRYYRAWTADRIQAMSGDEFYEFISKLWSMLIWGNKKYVVDKLVADNGFQTIKSSLATLIWSDRPVAERWNTFRSKIKGMGPAAISELLCHVHTDSCAIWNRPALVGLRYLEVPNLPKYDYQVTGDRYVQLSTIVSEIAAEMHKQGFRDTSLLAADYFIWDQLQTAEALPKIGAHEDADSDTDTAEEALAAQFVHNDVRDKVAEIGAWLGFQSRIEVKVADGSKVDAVWEATIGNMGRVIYVFEVQTKGSIDSLIINLLKALNNPAVQGVVAVSDALQIETIRRHATPVKQLVEKLRYWNYTEVLDVHEKQRGVNESINRLRLVPEGF